MKNILITGGTGFIGRKLCIFFLKKKFRVFCLDYKDEKNFFVKNTKKKFKKNFLYFRCNLEQHSEIKNFLKEIKKYGRIDTVINNAAITGDSFKSGWNTNFQNQTYINFERALKVNLLSVFEICKGLKDNLIKSKSPSIINISSIYSNLAHDKSLYVGSKIYNPAAYSASKAGLNQLTRWMASELSPKIRVNSISPGGISRSQSKSFKKKYISKTLLNRMAKEEDIINLIIFLSSEKSSYITGENITIDGGYSIK